MREDLGTLSQALLKNFLKEVFKNFKNFKQGDFCSLLFVVLILMQPFSVLLFPAAPSRIPPAKCGRFHSLRYRIEMVEKDLGTLSQTLLRKLLRKFSKNFQNFNQGDFRSLLFVVPILM